MDGTGDEADGFPRMRAYAYKTAHFKVRSHRRDTNNQVLLPTFDLEPCLIASRVDASSGVDFAETIDQIGRLPDQQRRTLALKLLGLDDSEVARTLGVGETTVRSNLTHARRKLTDYLAEWLPPGVCGGARRPQAPGGMHATSPRTGCLPITVDELRSQPGPSGWSNVETLVRARATSTL